MEIRDAIHGSILVDRNELPIVDSRFFQRLRQIKQLGFAEHSFPSATHNRYIHSLGAMHTASRAFDCIFSSTSSLPTQARERFRALVRLTALLHDVGHGPLSHTTEFAMPKVDELEIPGKRRGSSKKATHEDYTLKILLDSELSEKLDRAGAQLGFGRKEVAALIDPEIQADGDFFREPIDGVKVDFQPILHQLISSELDADRMDYLRRDSLYAGVSYGQFDHSWLMSNLSYQIVDHSCYLSLQHRALYAFEDFLLSRFNMFLMVYFHYKSVVYDEMLAQYLRSEDCTYRLPADIERYGEATDAALYADLSASRNPWAGRIVEKKPYRILIELHSGIPATGTAAAEQRKLFQEVEESLRGRGIHSLVGTSTSELSKYFQRPGDPIFVRYDNHYSAPTFIPLEKCTDLFKKYSEKRSITRIYVSPEDFPRCRHDGRHVPFKYEELPAPEGH